MANQGSSAIVREMNRRALAAVIVLCAVSWASACSRKVADYPIPPNAARTDGLAYVVLHPGRGLPAMQGGIWGVQTRLISHTERGCNYPCETFLLYRRFSDEPHPWNGLVKDMRQGEVRRVWLISPKNREPLVYEVELASVVRVDSAGKPVVDDR
jgi:hypothetical protein